MADKRYLNVRYNSHFISEVNVTATTRIGELQKAVSQAFSLGKGFFLNVKTNPPSSNEAMIGALNQQRSYSHPIPSLTANFKAFKDTQFVDNCFISLLPASLPSPLQELDRLYVWQCYKDVFDLLMKQIGEGRKTFAITGTPGTGKSLFFVYMLRHLMDQSVDLSPSQTLPLNPARIVYHTGNSYRCYDLEKQAVFLLEPIFASLCVLERRETLYVVDGMTNALESSCVTLFIGSPMSDAHWTFRTDIYGHMCAIRRYRWMCSLNGCVYTMAPTGVLTEPVHIPPNSHEEFELTVIAIYDSSVPPKLIIRAISLESGRPYTFESTLELLKRQQIIKLYLSDPEYAANYEDQLKVAMESHFGTELEIADILLKIKRNRFDRKQAAKYEHFLKMSISTNNDPLAKMELVETLKTVLARSKSAAKIQSRNE
ncbi:hypothetical protein HDU81_006251, partial [Chytriomyces hyalinus]